MGLVGRSNSDHFPFDVKHNIVVLKASASPSHECRFYHNLNKHDYHKHTPASYTHDVAIASLPWPEKLL